MHVNCKIFIQDISGGEGDMIERVIVQKLYRFNPNARPVNRTHEESAPFTDRYNFTYHLYDNVSPACLADIFSFVEDFGAVLM